MESHAAAASTAPSTFNYQITVNFKWGLKPMTSTSIYPPIIDETIEEVAYQFAAELMRLRQRMAWNDYHIQSMTLRVSHCEGKATAEIEARVGNSYSNSITVKGASLGVVMDEVYRRLNYEDKEAGRIATSLQRLEPPPESPQTPTTED